MRTRHFAFTVIVIVIVNGCGGSTSSHGVTGGTAGALPGGSGGVGATGGAHAGAGGTSSGGSAGTAGNAGGWHCTRDADCHIVGDCCGCWALPTGSGSTCPLDCALDHCTDFATRPEARCVFGQCVLDVSCRGQVLCPALPPNCGPGNIPSVEGECYGPCVAATECLDVPDCDRCDGPTQACVFELGAVGVAHCVDVPSACTNDRTCACMSSLCGAIAPCQDLSNGISCGGG
jgi:hypothetical protein